MNYKLVLQYDGTRYDGWQKQGNTSQKKGLGQRNGSRGEKNDEREEL